MANAPVARPTLTGRMLNLICPDGIPPERTQDVPRAVLHLEAAAAILRGEEPHLPLAAMFARAPVEEARDGT